MQPSCTLNMSSPLTKEAIDDSEEAAHGAYNRRNNFIVPLNLLITARVTVSFLTLTWWGELQGQQLSRGGHDGRDERRIR